MRGQGGRSRPTEGFSRVQFNSPRPWNKGRVKPKTFWNFFCSAKTVVPFWFGICWYIYQVVNVRGAWSGTIERRSRRSLRTRIQVPGLPYDNVKLVSSAMATPSTHPSRMATLMNPSLTERS